jgi:hypothetical protein
MRLALIKRGRSRVPFLGRKIKAMHLVELRVES